MARIRSIHPGQWTDEQFVMCSPWAQLLCIAIRNEADDAGLFEWKPIGLKMRLLPAASVDVAALLGELATAGLLMRYEYGGKPYGAIKNFGKWQSPKKPSRKHPATASVLAYTGYENPEDLGDLDDNNGGNTPKPDAPTQQYPEPVAESSEPVPNQYGTGQEKSRQRDRELDRDMEFIGTPHTPRQDPKPSSEPAPPLSAAADPFSEPEPELDLLDFAQPVTALVVHTAAQSLPVQHVAVPYEAAAAIWNEICGDLLPNCKSWPKGRTRAFAARFKNNCKGNLEVWREVCQRVRASDFCCGYSDRGWRADIDFALQESSWAKIIEGKYDNVKTVNKTASAVSLSGLMARIHERNLKDREYDDEAACELGALPALPWPDGYEDPTPQRNRREH